ncbi:hypothetical protein SALBM311S_04717 [Streptomyces alboniger]
MSRSGRWPLIRGATPATWRPGGHRQHRPSTETWPPPTPPDPGRLLLGPLHRHAVVGFHLDAVYTALFVRPVRAGAPLVRFLDREVVETYVSGAAALPRLLGTAVRRAQTGNLQTYVSALLAGTVVLVDPPPSSSPPEREQA